MIPQLHRPWLPLKMVLGGLSLVAMLLCLVPDALFAAEQLDVVLSNQFLMAHQLVIGLLFLRLLRLFHKQNAPFAAQLARNASFAVALASKPIAHHAAVLRAAGCKRVLAITS